MADLPESMERLIGELRRLPTVGKKTAQRMAIKLVSSEGSEAEDLAKALIEIKRKLHPCPICGNITEDKICSICSNPKRDRTTICVVEDVQNLMAMERGGNYNGLYYVLKGLISPMHDMGPDQIGLDRLFEIIKRAKLKGRPIREIILAISPTVEGETTMLFMADLLNKEGVEVSRIASGIPVGGNLEYYDELTLAQAMQDRRKLKTGI